MALPWLISEFKLQALFHFIQVEEVAIIYLFIYNIYNLLSLVKMPKAFAVETVRLSLLFSYVVLFLLE